MKTARTGGNDCVCDATKNCMCEKEPDQSMGSKPCAKSESFEGAVEIGTETINV